MWLALTLFAFVAFLTSLFSVARRGFDAAGHFLPAGRWLIFGAALSFVVWLFALSHVAPPYSPENLKRYELPQ